MTTCDHCDDSVPHEHIDPERTAARVRARARSLAWWAGARGPVLAVAAALAAAAGSLSVRSGDALLSAPLPLLAGAGALAWAAVTAVGLLVAGAAHRPASARGPQRALALGTVATAAATPVLALAVTLVLRPAAGAGVPWWPSALWVGLGWLAAASAADVAAAVRLRALLLAPRGRGEPERLAAARGPAPSEGRHLAGTVAGALVFAGWLVALGALPVLVVVLVPLHAALAAIVARVRASSQRAPASGTLAG